MTRLNKPTILISGGASGIGRALAERLSANGCEVWVVDLPSCPAPPNTHKISADLSSQAGVIEAVDAFKSASTSLDILINNVGAIFPERIETEDGFEKTFALNHLSYFAMTLRLLDALSTARHALIVNVSSSHYRAGTINFEDLMGSRNYGMNRAYCQSKLANVLFTIELAQRLQGTHIKTFAIHPGAIETGFGDGLPSFWRIMWRLSRPLRKSPEWAASGIHQAIQEAQQAKAASLYSANGKWQSLSDLALDDKTAARLWEVSCGMCGLPEATLSKGIT